jgi:hypothetical protein
MPVYKVFTWNMQRAQSVSQWNVAHSQFASQKDNTIKERYRVLKKLVDWADFGFITEPGQDIRNSLNDFTLPGLNRNFFASPLQDNQTESSACRPVVYSKTPFVSNPSTTELYISYLSGGQNAHRYPAAGIVKLRENDGQGNKELLLLSFHATSGFGADENCQGYFDKFYENFLGQAVPLVWIVGGDFNCNAGRAIYMPATSTHQSDHVLDGFFADQNGTNFEVAVETDAKTFLQSEVNNGEGKLETNTHTDPHGYVVNGFHLSDHCPVIMKLRIDRFKVRVDKADIITGPRTRRKSTNYKYT